MGLFDGVLKNASVQKMAFGHLKSIFADGKVKAIVISADSKGELVIDLYEKPVTVNELDDEKQEITQRSYGAGDVAELTFPINKTLSSPAPLKPLEHATTKPEPTGNNDDPDDWK